MAKTADDIRLGTIPYFLAKECTVIVRRLKVCDYLIGCVRVLYGREQGEFQVDIIAMLILVHTFSSFIDVNLYAYSESEIDIEDCPEFRKVKDIQSRRNFSEILDSVVISRFAKGRDMLLPMTEYAQPFMVIL
jgi:hypothetical protein